MHTSGGGGSGGGGGGGAGLRAEDVISKLKDDGDFDRLRVRIIRKLKENEQLRSNIISLVKQSTALNCPGAEKMKPRQLSDAIHQEIGDKLMSQISDGVWNIIRSPDGMKPEITETVQSVYDKLANPHGKDNGESSSPMKPENNISANGARENNGRISDGDPNEPPGFGLTSPQTPHKRNKNDHTSQPYSIGITPHNGQTMEENKGKNLLLEKPENLDAPPGFSCVLKHTKSGESPDEDPEVPPGFG